jgi:hypothetical protein
MRFLGKVSMKHGQRTKRFVHVKYHPKNVRLTLP